MLFMWIKRKLTSVGCCHAKTVFPLVLIMKEANKKPEFGTGLPAECTVGIQRKKSSRIYFQAVYKKNAERTVHFRKAVINSIDTSVVWLCGSYWGEEVKLQKI